MFVTLLQCLFFWFIISKLLLHFSIGPFFPSHLFTSTASFLSCKCLHNPILCCLINLSKPSASFARWPWLLHAQGHCSCCGPSVLLSPCTLGNLDFILAGGRAQCAVSLPQAPAQSTAAPAEGFGLPGCPPWNPLLLPSALKQVSWWSLLFSFCWFTLCLTNFWPYQCVLLTLTLHFRGQALFYFISHKCRLNFENFRGQNIMWIHESCISGFPLF